MRINTVKEKWDRGDVTFGAWLSIPSSFSAEVMAHQGFDWVCIDMQHGVIDYQVALTMLQAIGATETIPIVRVPWNEPGIIGKVLDAGAMGVIIPMVNSVEEAKQAVAACRYFPQGSRSFGPTRAATTREVTTSAGRTNRSRASR
ncbi:aldolase/citrate lyase family protein [Candidatus Amarobacter glycogenicus]|uniref:HpcH/HpaI aldolase family protein n=1 Tax=Candidatus Amarobacter glycogenicus TaxID=3140699 RepID=UPI0031CC46C2